MRTIPIFNAVAATSDKYSMALIVAEAAGIRKGLVAVAASAAAMSALESRRFVETSLDAPLTLKNRTTVIVAPSIQHTDFIAVYAGGGIVELGMRDQLLQLPRGGVYQTLVSKQM
ncbi:hypothetical protein DYB28_001527 [Aphanomyces astaci]|uniref:Uncharacterized protein n=1 Tax=Aphanomyces astaci TaxID=112090 RepID=A0A9X8E0F6_APHAT|nr:hypothetical protein DYB28_001527 [Aphanomyces astaci]